MQCQPKVVLGLLWLISLQLMPGWRKPLSSGIHTWGFARVAALSKVVNYFVRVWERRLSFPQTHFCTSWDFVTVWDMWARKPDLENWENDESYIWYCIFILALPWVHFLPFMGRTLSSFLFYGFLTVHLLSLSTQETDSNCCYYWVCLC